MKKFTITAFALLIFANAQSQTIIGTAAEKIYRNASEIDFGKSNSPEFIKFKSDKTVAPESVFIELKTVLKMQPADSWQLIRKETDELHFTHYRYQQFYKNVKVETGEYLLHAQNGSMKSANGFFYDRLNLTVTPTLTESSALKSALENTGASVYKWQLPSEEKWLKEGKKNEDATFYPKGELVIIKMRDAGKSNAFKLAWKFDIYAHEPMSRNYVYVDAHTGNILQKENRICEFIANGTAVTMYSGTKQIVTDSIAPTTFRLRDYSRGANIETYNLNHGTNYGTATNFTDADNLWNTTANQDNAAYDAHFGAEMTWDYYSILHTRNSYDGLGSPLKSYVHYSSSYNNAFWDGSVMTYGDGNGTTFSPLTQLDVCGHELTHGVTETSSNLNYAYESGALNESFSDIFGTCVEFYANPATANFLVGEQCYTPNTPGDALRFMNNPNLASDPDTYLGTYWYAGTGDNGGVHTNSGVQNFWFYLLSQGGTGTNDFAFNYNVSGIGIINAGKIAFRTNTFYLTSGSGYANARTLSIQAAADLFGACSNQQLQTANAWSAVGVNGVYVPNPLATASNSGIVCEGGVVNLSSAGGTTFSWTGPGGFNSTQQNPSLSNVSVPSAGAYSVVVTDANGCSGTVTTTVSVKQNPTVSATASPAALCAGATVSLGSSSAAYGLGAPVLTSNTNRISVPDANNTGIVSPMTVSGSPANANNVAWIEIDSISHTWDADLAIYLIAPNNSQITLANGVGGSGDGFSHTIFSAAALNLIGSAGNNTAPFNGTYAPQQPFSNLTGIANGTWKLKIVDAYSQDTGSVWGWKIAIPGPNAVTVYAWSPSGGLTSSTLAATTGTVSSSTVYTLAITDAKGCTTTATTSVAVNPIVSATTSSTNVTCTNTATGTITVTTSSGTPPFEYSINGGNYQSSNIFNGLIAGIYTISVRDINQCNTVLISETVGQNSTLNFTSVSMDANCYGSNTGQIDVTVGGGVPSYTYLWNDGVTTQDRLNVAAGNYSVVVTDASGCTISNSITLIQLPDITVTASTTNINCYGGNTGQINVTANGGAGAYNYLWNDGNTNNNRTGLTAGNYSVIVTDEAGCIKSASMVLTQSTEISVTTSIINTSCFGLNNGSLNALATGGNPTYSYLWSTGNTAALVTNLYAGNYSLTVTDFTGCTKVNSITINQPSQLNVAGTVSNVLCYGQANGSVTITASGSNAPYFYSWSNGNTSSNLSNVYAGNYLVTVSDVNGCTTQASYIVSQPASGIIVNISKTNVRCGGASTGNLTALPIGGTAPYSYIWNNGNVTSGISNCAAGTYTVTITDANGCTNIKTVNITQNPPLVALVLPFIGSATVNVSGGVGPYTYLWKTTPAQTTVTATGLIAGTIYKVKVTDTKSCTKLVQFTMPAPKVASTNENGLAVTLYPNPTDGAITLQLNSASSLNYSLMMYDATGRLLINKKELKPEGIYSNTYDFSDLPKGFYMLKISDDKISKLLRVDIQ